MLNPKAEYMHTLVHSYMLHVKLLHVLKLHACMAIL